MVLEATTLRTEPHHLLLVFKGAIPGIFFVYFLFLKQTLELLQQIYDKKVQPVYSAGIRIHNLQDMSLLH